MSKKPPTFRKNDVKRGIEALRAAGFNVGRVEIDKASAEEAAAEEIKV